MLKIWAIPVVLASAAAAAPAAAELAVEGNAAFGDAEIEAAAYRDGAVDAGAVERLYLRAGYLDARVESTAEEGAPPALTITEGAQYRVAALDVDNDSPLSRGEVAAFIPFGPGDAPSPPDLREGLIALLAELADRGYLRAEAEYAVTDAGPARVDVAVAVRAGERYAAGEIHLRGVNPRDEDAIREKFETRPGKPVRERALARDLLTIIDYYRERGYPAASARPRAFEFAEPYKEIDFDVIIEPGDRVTVSAVDIVGNRRTRDAVIRRELLTVPGEPYDIERLRKSARRIYNLKYFEAEPEVELVDADAGRLRVTVAERPTYRVTGALAYEPRQDETDAALIGEMAARLANLFGTGRELDARYRRLAAESTDAAATYYEPWIGGVDLFAQPSGLYKERTTYRKASGELALGTHPLVDLTVAAGGGFDRVWEENASRKYKVFTWATYDSRDYFDNPRRGWQAYGRVELGVKEYLADGFRERVPRLELDAWRFRPTTRNQVLAARGRAQGFVSQRTSLDEVFPLGGYADLRGFKEEQFLTDRQALATVEYRFLTGRGGRLFLFVDAAYRHLKTDETFDEGVSVGYGAGFRAATPVGTYGVDYGLAAGDSPLDGKIHVSITQEF
jgi:outer membrane protein assembly factor BamA